MAKTAKKKIKTELSAVETPDLFSRVKSIIEKAQDNVLRAVNTNMVIAYWLIVREIVTEIQQGKERAVYGNSVIDKLSELLTFRYKRGYSKTSLWDYRRFYMTFPERIPEILHIGCGEFNKGFSPNLGWSHYRALMRVDIMKMKDCFTNWKPNRL